MTSAPKHSGAHPLARHSPFSSAHSTAHASLAPLTRQPLHARMRSHAHPPRAVFSGSTRMRHAAHQIGARSLGAPKDPPAKEAPQHGTHHTHGSEPPLAAQSTTRHPALHPQHSHHAPNPAAPFPCTSRSRRARSWCCVCVCVCLYVFICVLQFGIWSVCVCPA